MRKLFGCLLVVMMSFVACEGPVGPPGRDGRDGIDGEFTYRFTNDYDVWFDEWISSSEEGDGYFFYYFEHEISIPQLTKFVFDEGFVGCYLVQEIVYENGKKALVQRPLPYTIYGFDGGEPYSENYSFEIRTGYIKFIVKYSDFGEIQPLSCTFHVVMMW